MPEIGNLTLFNLSETVGFSGTAGFSFVVEKEDVVLLAAYLEVYPVGEVTPALPVDDNENFFTPREGDESEPDEKSTLELMLRW